MRLPSSLHSASSVVMFCWCFLSCLGNGDADTHRPGLLGNQRNDRVRGRQEAQPPGVCGVIENPAVFRGQEPISDPYASILGFKG